MQYTTPVQVESFNGPGTLLRCSSTSILFKRCQIGNFKLNDVDLSMGESVSTFPPADEHDTYMYNSTSPSPFESFTAMLNCGNESTASGESFIELHVHVFHLPKPLSQSVS